MQMARQIRTIRSPVKGNVSGWFWRIGSKIGLLIGIIAGLGSATYFGAGMLRGINQIAISNQVGNEGITAISWKQSLQIKGTTPKLIPSDEDDSAPVSSDPTTNRKLLKKLPVATNRRTSPLTRAELPELLEIVKRRFYEVWNLSQFHRIRSGRLNPC